MISRMDRAPSSVRQEPSTLVVGQTGSSLAMALTNGLMGIHFKDSFGQARSKAKESLFGRISAPTMAHGCRTGWKVKECLYGLMDAVTRGSGKKI